MKHHLLSIFLLAAASGSQAATIINVAAGNLEELLDGLAPGETSLSLTGTLNITDLRAIAALPQRHPSVREIDMTDAVIVSSRIADGDYLGYTYLPALELPPYIFANAPFSSLALPSTLSAIGEGALSGAAIASVSIPADVVAIGDFAFYGCPALREVKAGNKLATLGKGSFANCPQLLTADFGSTAVTELPERIFAGCAALENLPLPTSLMTVGPEAFAGTGITSLSLSAVKQLAPFSLSSMPAANAVTLPADAEQGDGTLAASTALTRLQGTPEEIPDLYVAGCSSLNPYDFLRDASSIGESALAGTKAGTLVLSATLASVGRGAFDNIAGLAFLDVTALDARVPATQEGAFEALSQPDITLIVSEAGEEAWRADPQWGGFRIIPSGATGATPSIADGGIKIAASADAITVSADVPIRQLLLISTDGRMLLNAAPQRESVTIAAPQENIVILRAVTDSGIRSASLLLR